MKLKLAINQVLVLIGWAHIKIASRNRVLRTRLETRQSVQHYARSKKDENRRKIEENREFYSIGGRILSVALWATKRGRAKGLVRMSEALNSLAT